MATSLSRTTFEYDGDRPQSVTTKVLEPIAVGLKQHDVRPRAPCKKLAKMTLSDLGKNVAKEAPVELGLSAAVP
jgi:hypothetical protein